jgi:alkaline phosphatase D
MGQEPTPKRNRRQFLTASGALILGGSLPARLLHAADELRFKADPFTLGVASGYPNSNSIVLWTRLAPEPTRPDGGIPASEVVPVTCEIASDERMRNIVLTQEYFATAQHAHSVHFEPTGLSPARDYWYRFTAGGFRSVVGRTRTASAPNAAQPQLRIALASCQQYEHGYFVAYRHMLDDELDAVLHVGDYIYESSWGNARIRQHDAPDAITLDDYRRRHALYRGDKDLQAAHARYPWLVTWDDHEVENDYAGDSSQTDDPKAWFLARRAAAYQAYYEHMPLPRRAMPFGSDLRLYAQRTLGTLANVMMLDTRQYRSPLACTRPYFRGSRRTDCAELKVPERTKLGAIQESWLAQQLARSRTTWNLLAQGTVMSYINEGRGDKSKDSGQDAYWTDSWNGYHAARERLMTMLAETRAKNPVVLSGDIHAFLVGNLHRTPSDLGSAVIASEFVCTSISSEAGSQKSFDAIRAQNPNLLLANGEKHGYLRLHLTPERLRADLIGVDSVTDPNSRASTYASYVVEDGKPGPVLSGV